MMDFVVKKTKKKNKIGRLAQMKNDRSLTNPLNTEVSLIWKIGVLGYKTVQSHSKSLMQKNDA